MIKDLYMIDKLNYDPLSEYTWWCCFLIAFAITLYYLSKFDS